ncbi:recombinase family protein [Desulfuribacillus alkaliarsenatis]|uniref:Resolvase n=1 Tax=Desulfuribacillus alkaliarsenatis TaxID=766136 RepID=A0A1E5G3W3_9FIRM|nr:recombinase family protein [Desulfuribacillus alkaliarsenatis]OEF97772.1 resolvase [Desulfuribacillus alkaliarsenatis]
MAKAIDKNTDKSIALYCRVSTDEQAREGVSLDEQQVRLKSYCRAMGWDITPLVFVDDGYSAKSTDRPQLNKLLAKVKAGELSKVMVTKLDRMSRRLLDLLKMIDLFQEHDVSFISISESFDTNTPSGRLTLQVLGAVAEFERERIRERVFENMFHAAKGGKWLTQSPYGYRLQDKELVVHDEEAKIVQRVYDAYLEKGLGYFAIAKMLNEEGIPSRFNKEWSLRSVKLMLTNPAYKGTLVWNRVDSSKKSRKEKDESEWVSLDDCLPVIINEDKWESVQKRVNGTQIAPRAKSSPHLLGGLLKCGNCGSGMSIGWSGSKNKRYRVYRCSANKNKGTCTSKQYRADDVEKWFKEGLKKLLDSLDESLVPMIIEQKKEKYISNIQDRINVAKKRYERKVEAYSAGLITIEDLKLEKDRMKQDIKLLKEIEMVQEDQFDIGKITKDIQKKTSEILESLEVLTIEESKALIFKLIEKIILIKNSTDIKIYLRN